MILEGIITTVSPTGAVNIAPMGPAFGDDPDRFYLRPYPTSHTYQNLTAHGEGVLHVTDDVLLLARAAIGPVEPAPIMVPAQKVRGFVLADTCRWLEFRVLSVDTSQPRVRIEAEVVHRGRLRDFFGFNRAKHAVVEAAILATRTAFLPLTQIEAELAKLAGIVAKTGGRQESVAFEVLQNHVRQAALDQKSRLSVNG
jgi:hypothetical protein